MQTVETILNIPATGSPLALIDRINDGLPLQAVETFARRAALEPATKYRIIGKATLARRRMRREPLSREEGARLARLAKVWALAEEVWGGTEPARLPPPPASHARGPPPHPRHARQRVRRGPRRGHPAQAPLRLRRVTGHR